MELIVDAFGRPVHIVLGKHDFYGGGTVANEPPAHEKWDVTTAHAYIIFRETGALNVHNDGILS